MPKVIWFPGVPYHLKGDPRPQTGPVEDRDLQSCIF